MTPRKKYASAPIEEALVEFQMVPSVPWNWTVPGRVWSELRNVYDGGAFSGLVQVSGAGVAWFGTALTAPQRVFLGTAGREFLVGLAPDQISVHALRPYRGWETLAPRIPEVLAGYRVVASPAAIRRIVVRYINKIKVASGTSIVEYLKTGPFLPGVVGEAPSHISAFATRMEAPYADGSLLRITVQSQPGGQDALLDIETIAQPLSPISMESAMDVVELLHAREGSAFEAVITDKLREQIDK